MTTNFIIRQNTTAELKNIYEFIQTAFKTAEHKDGDEQDFAVNLRNGENYIPQLELVAEANGEIIGHIMFTRTCVIKPNGSEYSTLLVAPLSVSLEHRSSGVGSALMKEGLRLARQMGYTSAFLCGDPNYYKRFGYTPTHLYGIKHKSIPQEYVMVKR